MIIAFIYSFVIFAFLYFCCAFVEYETLEDKEILETASRTRLALGRANQRLADAAEKVKQLESQAADANEDLIRTRTELEASEKRAEEVKKAAEGR